MPIDLDLLSRYNEYRKEARKSSASSSGKEKDIADKTGSIDPFSNVEVHKGKPLGSENPGFIKLFNLVERFLKVKSRFR